MKDTISDFEILLIRQCKKNGFNLDNFRKLIAKHCALSYPYVNKSDVAHYLTRIVIDYNLVHNWHEFLLVDLDPKKWWTNEVKDYTDNLIEQLVGMISITEIKVFPRYHSPAYFRNKYGSINCHDDDKAIQ